MEMTQMNIRIPAHLKKSGDAVLSRYGKTSSEIVRNVWAFMTDHQKLPSFKEETETVPAEIQRRLDLVEKYSHFIEDFCAEHSLTYVMGEYEDGETYDRLREEMYEEAMLEDYEALNA